MHHCGALYRLIFSGKQMSDDKTAKEYNVEGGSVLHLVRGEGVLPLGRGVTSMDHVPLANWGRSGTISHKYILPYVCGGLHPR